MQSCGKSVGRLLCGTATGGGVDSWLVRLADNFAVLMHRLATGCRVTEST